MADHRTVTPENDLNADTRASENEQGVALLSLNIRVDEADAPVQFSVTVPENIALTSAEPVRTWLEENIYTIIDQIDENANHSLRSIDGKHRHVITDVVMKDVQNFSADVTFHSENIDISTFITATDDEVYHKGHLGSDDNATSGMDTPRSTSSESGEICETDMTPTTPSSVTMKGKQLKFHFPRNPAPPRSAKGPRRRRNGDSRSSRDRLSFPTEESRLSPEQLTQAQQVLDIESDIDSNIVGDSGMLSPGIHYTNSCSSDMDNFKEAKQNFMAAVQVLEEARYQLKDKNELLEQQLEEMRCENKDLQERLKTAEDVKNKVIEENDEYKIKRDQLEKDVMRLQGQVTSTWEEKTKIKELYIRLDNKIKDTEKANEEFRRQLEQKTSEAAILRKRLSGNGIEWVGQIENLKDEINKLKSDKAAGDIENNKMKTELENMKALTDDLQSKYDEEKKRHFLLMKSFNDVKDSNNNMKMRNRLRRNSIGNGTALPLKPGADHQPQPGGAAKPTTPPKVLPEMLTKVALTAQQFKAKFENSRSMTETFPPLTRRK